MPPDRAQARPVAVGLAGPAVFRMGDRDEVVDEERRPDVPAGIEPVEPPRVVEAQVRGVQVERVLGQDGDRPAAQRDVDGLARLDPAPLGGPGPRRGERRRRGGGIAAPGREPPVDRVRRGVPVLDPAGRHRLDDLQRLRAIEDARSERRGDDADARLRPAEIGARVGEVDAVDARRARVAQPRDEAREIEGDRSVRHDPRAIVGVRPPRSGPDPREPASPRGPRAPEGLRGRGAEAKSREP